MGIEILLSAIALAAGEPSKSAVPLGESVQGRPIRAVRLGDRGSPHKVLVVGCIHGNECAGTAVTRRLVRRTPPARFDLWVVHNVNPDGRRLGIRQNARGVDLNRNFPAGWRRLGRRWDLTYSGPRPLSEPEARVARRLILAVRPDLTIWYHQPQALIRTGGRNDRSARRYARLVGMQFRRLPVPPGAATRWQLRRFPGTSAFVVELAPGSLSARRAVRHARAILRLAKLTAATTASKSS